MEISSKRTGIGNSFQSFFSKGLCKVTSGTQIDVAPENFPEVVQLKMNNYENIPRQAKNFTNDLVEQF